MYCTCIHITAWILSVPVEQIAAAYTRTLFTWALAWDKTITMPLRNSAGIKWTRFASVHTMPVRYRFWGVFSSYFNFTLITVDNIYHSQNVSSNRNQTLTVMCSHSAHTVKFRYVFKLLRTAINTVNRNQGKVEIRGKTRHKTDIERASREQMQTACSFMPALCEWGLMAKVCTVSLFVLVCRIEINRRLTYILLNFPLYQQEFQKRQMLQDEVTMQYKSFEAQWMQRLYQLEYNQRGFGFIVYAGRMWFDETKFRM